MASEPEYGSWDWLMFWCVVRARITRHRQRIYHTRVGGQWRYWSTAASAGYGMEGDGDQIRREMLADAARILGPSLTSPQDPYRVSTPPTEWRFDGGR